MYNHPSIPTTKPAHTLTEPTSPRYPATSIITEAINNLQNRDDCTTAIAAKIKCLKNWRNK